MKPTECNQCENWAICETQCFPAADCPIKDWESYFTEASAEGLAQLMMNPEIIENRPPTIKNMMFKNCLDDEIF